MPLAYYNEIDPFAAQWLRNLISAGHIAYGVVDERDIRDVRPDDLRPFTQCHFFAGIGVWSHALRSAGWPDSRPVWTGSCPCQPFSMAGRGGGFADERHLWPHWYHLIRCLAPVCVFGEQVASKDGLAWLDLVQSDMEATGAAFGAVDICAAGLGAPHIRQRLYWLADNAESRRESRRRLGEASGGRIAPRVEPGRLCTAGELGNAERTGLERHCGDGNDRNQPGRFGTLTRGHATATSGVSGVADSDGGNARTEGLQRGREYGLRTQDGRVGRSFWSECDWIPCTDGKARPVEPGTFPLVNGASGRVGRLRAYGNAIVAQCATEFVEAYMSAAL